MRTVHGKPDLLENSEKREENVTKRKNTEVGGK